MEDPAPHVAPRPKRQGPLAVKSKAAKPAADQQKRAPGQGLIEAIHSRLHTSPMPATGLLSIAAARPPMTGVANPQMPATPPDNPGPHTPTKEDAPTKELYLHETEDQAGSVNADITHLAEQRAMQMVHRYQTLSVETDASTSAGAAESPVALPPVTPPVSLYANLAQEWPLARLSVQLRHIGVLLRVTLYRRVAELSFRGVNFRQLPREVMRNVCYDFNNICGELARRLASLFNFLTPEPGTDPYADPTGLSLYADPAYWLYGLLSFCAKACESKTEEANGAPVLGAKEDGDTPALEATGRTLALMQTVVMSFGRNISLGKPDLPIHHLHVYFPVQLVHKLVERMTDLKFKDITPEEGKRYKHNSESETNSPYIVVSTFEGACPSNTFAGLPETTKLAGAYEYGLLDGNLGHMVSFQSTYKSTLRIEVPVWPEVLQAVVPKNKANARLGRPGIAPSAPPVRDHSQGAAPSSYAQDNTAAESPSVKAADEEAEEEEDDTYVSPEGQGCFSFRQSLLLRAKDTYAARCTGNKYEIISKWLLTGLAVVLSRPNWQILATTTDGDTGPASLTKMRCLMRCRGITPFLMLTGRTEWGGSVIPGTYVNWRQFMQSAQG